MDAPEDRDTPEERDAPERDVETVLREVLPAARRLCAYVSGAAIMARARTMEAAVVINLLIASKF